MNRRMSTAQFKYHNKYLNFLFKREMDIKWFAHRKLTSPIFRDTNDKSLSVKCDTLVCLKCGVLKIWNFGKSTFFHFLSLSFTFFHFLSLSFTFFHFLSLSFVLNHQSILTVHFRFFRIAHLSI